MTNWIVVPIRNGIAYTKACLPALRNQDIGGELRILVIDNDSTDGSGQWLRSQSDVLYWHRRPPLSVAASWNLALRWLFGEQRAEYVWVVNNDTAFHPSSYRWLVEDGGLFVTLTGCDDPSCISELTRPDKAHNRPHPDFSAYLIRKECWQKIGPFDEEFQGAYAEDSDYHVRMHRADIRAESMETPFYHAASGTIKTASAKEAAVIQECAHNNRVRFLTKYGCLPGTPGYESLFT